MKLSEYNKLSKEERKQLPASEVPKAIKKTMVVLLGLVVLVVAGVAWSASQQKATPKTPESVVKNMGDGSVWQVTYWLENNLNDGNSYEGLKWYKVRVVDTEPLTYEVRHQFRAANALGAKTISEKLFYLDSTGKVINVKDF